MKAKPNYFVIFYKYSVTSHIPNMGGDSGNDMGIHFTEFWTIFVVFNPLCMYNFTSFQSSSHHLCNSKSQLLFPNISLSQSCHILQHFALHLIIYFVSCFLFLQAELSQALTSLTEKARNAKDFMVQLKHTVEHVQVGISVVIISCSLFMFIENMFSMVQGYRCGWNFMSKFRCLWNEEQYSMLIWQIFWMVVL